MKSKALLSAAAFVLMSAPALVRAQEATPVTPATPEVASTFFVRGNFLGVRTEEVTRENASRYGLSGEPRGVGVTEVVKGSPAEKAGLRDGDVILRFDGEQVTSVRKLTRLIEEAGPEHTARLTVSRRGSEQELSATLSRREPFMTAGAGDLMTVYPNLGEALGGEALKNSDMWKRNEEKMRKQFEEMGRKHPGLFGFGSSRRIGVATTPLGKQLADYFGVSHGVLISSVEANSPAEKAGLRAGDVVTEVDGKQVEDADDLVGGLGAKEEGEVTLTVTRDRKQRTVRVTPERRQPQGFELKPGSFRVVMPPVAAHALPRMATTPLMPATPMTLVTPRVFATPRIMATPRVTVVRPGRIL